MRAETRFSNLSKRFWANVRTISQHRGYTERRTHQVKIHSVRDMLQSMHELELGTEHLIDASGKPTDHAELLHDYFEFRARVLNTFVEPRLMDVTKASALYKALKRKLTPSCPLPKNKQKGGKAGPAYLTCIVNMLVEASAEGIPVDYDPRELTTVTQDGEPVRTLARRVDGAFPSPVNPQAVWEIKEYYYTTTFGSRVADGVYETLLDGMELEELHSSEGIWVEHLLIVDAHYTWWECGRSYLCRMIDMLHMGYVDEILFGAEVVQRLPAIVKQWVQRYREIDG